MARSFLDRLCIGCTAGATASAFALACGTCHALGVSNGRAVAAVSNMAAISSSLGSTLALSLAAFIIRFRNHFRVEVEVSGDASPLHQQQMHSLLALLSVLNSTAAAAVATDVDRRDPDQEKAVAHARIAARRVSDGKRELCPLCLELAPEEGITLDLRTGGRRLAAETETAEETEGAEVEVLLRPKGCYACTRCSVRMHPTCAHAMVQHHGRAACPTCAAEL